MNNIKYFWKNKSPLSQWYGDWMNDKDSVYEGGFILNDIYYRTSEHYMMMEKALLFKDEHSMIKMKYSNHPRKVKDLGREVKNFNNDIWLKNREDIVYKGNYVKFSQNPKIRDFLLSTEENILVEASPYDLIWGIGLEEKDAVLIDSKDWPGKNLLGKILMKVRTNIKENMLKDPEYYKTKHEIDSISLKIRCLEEYRTSLKSQI